MQILLNQNDLRAAVIAQVQDLFALKDDQSLSVEITDEGATVTILSPGEELEPVETKPAGEQAPRRRRRTKAEIEADERAEAEAKAAREAEEAAASANGGEAGNVEPTPTTSADSVRPTETAQVADAGEPTQTEAEPESTSPGTPESEPEAATTQADPEPEPVVVQAEDVAAATQPEVKPEGVSLFKNLRKIQNS